MPADPSPPDACRVTDLRLVAVPAFARDGGEIAVVAGERDVPFAIARVFTVRSPAGTTRGMHAHRRCAQFMVCPQGAVEISCDDGVEQKAFVLDRGNVGLLVPPTIWAAETFLADNSLLVVVCDRPYEANDYIRDHTEFLAWRRQAACAPSGAAP
jgi:dTDP-4-dehydrorhamnose 3,5-epimerase-like enzyme